MFNLMEVTWYKPVPQVMDQVFSPITVEEQHALIQWCAQFLSPAQTASLSQYMNRHLGEDSTYSFKQALQVLLSELWFLCQHLDSDNPNKAVSLVLKIYERAEHCTAGFHNGILELLITAFYLPQSLDALLEKVRQDIVYKTAVNTTDEVHIHNLIFNVASTVFGTKAINLADPYINNTLAERIKLKLEMQFYMHFRIFNVLKALRKKMLDTLLEMGYISGHFDVQQLERIEDFIKKMFPHHPLVLALQDSELVYQAQLKSETEILHEAYEHWTFNAEESADEDLKKQKIVAACEDVNFLDNTYLQAYKQARQVTKQTFYAQLEAKEHFQEYFWQDEYHTVLNSDHLLKSFWLELKASAYIQEHQNHLMDRVDAIIACDDSQQKQAMIMDLISANENNMIHHLDILNLIVLYDYQNHETMIEFISKRYQMRWELCSQELDEQAIKRLLVGDCRAFVEYQIPIHFEMYEHPIFKSNLRALGFYKLLPLIYPKSKQLDFVNQYMQQDSSIHYELFYATFNALDPSYRLQFSQEHAHTAIKRPEDLLSIYKKLAKEECLVFLKIFKIYFNFSAHIVDELLDKLTATEKFEFFQWYFPNIPVDQLETKLIQLIDKIAVKNRYTLLKPYLNDNLRLQVNIFLKIDKHERMQMLQEFNLLQHIGLKDLILVFKNLPMQNAKKIELLEDYIHVHDDALTQDLSDFFKILKYLKICDQEHMVKYTRFILNAKHFNLKSFVAKTYIKSYMEFFPETERLAHLTAFSEDISKTLIDQQLLSIIIQTLDVNQRWSYLNSFKLPWEALIVSAAEYEKIFSVLSKTEQKILASVYQAHFSTIIHNSDDMRSILNCLEPGAELAFIDYIYFENHQSNHFVLEGLDIIKDFNLDFRHQFIQKLSPQYDSLLIERGFNLICQFKKRPSEQKILIEHMKKQAADLCFDIDDYWIIFKKLDANNISDFLELMVMIAEHHPMSFRDFYMLISCIQQFSLQSNWIQQLSIKHFAPEQTDMSLTDLFCDINEYMSRRLNTDIVQLFKQDISSFIPDFAHFYDIFQQISKKDMPLLLEYIQGDYAKYFSHYTSVDTILKQLEYKNRLIFLQNLGPHLTQIITSVDDLHVFLKSLGGTQLKLTLIKYLASPDSVLGLNPTVLAEDSILDGFYRLCMLKQHQSNPHQFFNQTYFNLDTLIEIYLSPNEYSLEEITQAMRDVPETFMSQDVRKYLIKHAGDTADRPSKKPRLSSGI